MPGKRESKEIRKKEIVEAAYNVAIREGLPAVTTRSVAIEAGLSNGLVHFHYPKKDDLMNALFDLLLNWLNSSEEYNRNFKNGKSCYFNGIVDELNTSASDRQKMRLFLEFWILSYHNDNFRKRLKKASESSTKYFTSLFNEDIKQGFKYTNQVNIKDINALSIAIILGSSLQELIQENWSNIHKPWKLLEDILQ